MKLLNFTIIKLTLCLVVGILIAHFVFISVLFSLIYTISFLLLLIILSKLSEKENQKRIWFDLVVSFAFIFIGILTYNFHNQKNFKNHYSNFSLLNDNLQTPITFKIRERLKLGTYHDKFIIDIIKINQQNVNGKSLLNVQKNISNSNLKIDDTYITYTNFKTLIHPLNPNQFDYKNYLEKQYIYHQIFTEKNALFKVKSQHKSIFGYADLIREHINIKLNEHHFKTNELAIINALLLGQRQDINEEIFNNYTNAGAIHILAVSGLHVGVLLFLLNFLFKPILYLKNGKTYRLIIVLILLWCFAIIAGLSASVTRAVTMFSIIGIAMYLKRATNIFNTLAISVFVLLLFKPMFLFDVGFQLSYLAVFSIVVVQPLLYDLWQPKWYIINFFWKIFTVTIAAQFGIIPISLYYFHQFPSLFIISNLAIIPFLGLILGLGIIVIILSIVNRLPEFLADFYAFIISSMNSIVEWISKQEQFLIKDIPFNIEFVIASYLLITSLILLYVKKNIKAVLFLIITLIGLQFVLIYNKYKFQENSIVIFHKSRQHLIAKQLANTLYIHHDFDSINLKNDNIIKNYKVGNFIKKIIEKPIESVYQLNNKTLLVIDSSNVYNVKSFKPNYILLTHSPKVNLNRVIDSLNPELIIVDGSNYKTYVNRWETTCIKRKVPIHLTSKKGAFIIK